MKRLWFRRKYFGWGWTPITWQGWAVLLVYLGAILWISKPFDQQAYPDSNMLIRYVIPFILLTSALIAVCYAKGEKPKWQWGKRK